MTVGDVDLMLLPWLDWFSLHESRRSFAFSGNPELPSTHLYSHFYSKQKRNKVPYPLDWEHC